MSVPQGKVYRRDQYDAVMRWVGPYSPIADYLPGDVVSLTGAAYLFIWKPASSSDPYPTTFPTPPNTTYWLAL